MKTFTVNSETSLEEAFEKSKEIVQNEDITFEICGNVNISKPIYIYNDTLPFENRRIVFEGKNDACINGGITVKNFTLFKDNIFVAHVPEVDYTRNLYIDGKFAYRPTTEKIKSERCETLEGNYRFVDSESPEKGIITADKRPLSWRNIKDVEIIFNVGWTHHIIPIESVSKTESGETKIVPMPVPYKASCEGISLKVGSCPNYFENVFEELKEPLTWYFDRAEKNLYVCLKDGDLPENHTFEIPLCEKILHIAGTKENKIGNIEFNNIKFANATFLRPNIYGFSNLQGEYAQITSLTDMPIRDIPYENDNIKIPAAIRLIATKNINFKNCKFVCLDSTALSMEFGTENCNVINCEFYELGAGAISAGDVGIDDRCHHPSDDREVVRKNTVTDCKVTNTGKDFFSTPAIMLCYVNKFEVSHCDINYVPYTGISLGWGWGHVDVSVGPYRKTEWKTPTVCSENKILYNHIHHHMSVLFDGGGIYTLGAMNGTEICGNLVHNAGDYEGDSYPVFCVEGYDVQKLNLPDSEPFKKKYFPGGIYLDEGSRGIHVSDNVIYNVPIPIFYHNQIDLGYTMVNVHDNSFGIKPDDKDFKNDIAEFAGRTKKH